MRAESFAFDIGARRVFMLHDWCVCVCVYMCVCENGFVIFLARVGSCECVLAQVIAVHRVQYGNNLYARYSSL